LAIVVRKLAILSSLPIQLVDAASAPIAFSVMRQASSTILMSTIWLTSFSPLGRELYAIKEGFEPGHNIEGRSQILNTVPYDDAKVRRDDVFGHKSKAGIISGTIWLQHHFARVRLEVPQEFGFQGFKMLYGPEDFIADRLKRSHNQPFPDGVELSA
jgi:hypothetical protein